MNVDSLLRFGLAVLSAPLLPGLVNRVKAVFAGRRGPPVGQLYFDLAKGLRKGLVLSATTTWVFRAGPVVSLAAALGAALLVPLGPWPAVASFPGDAIVFVCLFALARFFTTAAAMDTGSAFAGMGAAREAAFGCMAEPALLLGWVTLARTGGGPDMAAMFAGPAEGAAPMLLVAAGLFVVALAENCRIPVDDPNTHLELTMIHEAMALDHSGPLWGIIQYAASLKLFVFCALVAGLAAPWRAYEGAAAGAVLAGGIVVAAVAIGVVESVLARLRLAQVPNLLAAGLILCGFGAMLSLF
jgi:formate hydrogenlyase subunit 4